MKKEIIPRILHEFIRTYLRIEGEFSEEFIGRCKYDSVLISRSCYGVELQNWQIPFVHLSLPGGNLYRLSFWDPMIDNVYKRL